MSTISVEELLEEVGTHGDEESLPVATVVVPDIKAQSQYPKKV